MELLTGIFIGCMSIISFGAVTNLYNKTITKKRFKHYRVHSLLNNV
jgi:hypothetical protein